MRVLLTGSSGFVGTAFRRWFAEHQPGVGLDCIDIVEPDYDSPLAYGPTERWSFGRWDIRTWIGNDMSTRWPEARYDLAIHLAAVVGGRQTIDGNPLAVAVDLAIDADWWQWVLAAKPTKAVYFSSSAAYPAGLQTLNQGSGLLSAMNTYGSLSHAMWLRDDGRTLLGAVADTGDVYGMVKAVGEQQAALVAQRLAGRTGVHVFRPFSGYGPGQSLDYPVPAIVERAARGENPIDVWSETIRDFIHIDDVVAATMAHVGLPDPAPGEWTNLCTGRAVSFPRVAHLAAAAAGVEYPNVRTLTDKPTGPTYRVGDPTKMLRTYTPKISLPEGIALMVRQRKTLLALADQPTETS